MAFSITHSNENSFKAPAHKHAHHLHSIPPREKSVRTLIIDHMLWVHGRTRFAQARAELGMTDRTGGPSSPNYTHRTRPENYEEEDQVSSDGEDAVVLTSRIAWPGHPHDDPEETRIASQDLLLAKNLRLRAEGLEKVVTSMLVQPPPVHPIHDEDLASPPTSPMIFPTGSGDANNNNNASNSSNNNSRRPTAHQHTLPNGVRLRLALGTVINDLFSRQAPPPPFRSKRYAAAAAAAAAALPDPSVASTPSAVDGGDGGGGTGTTPSLLPLALSKISAVSAYSMTSERQGQRKRRAKGMRSHGTQGEGQGQRQATGTGSAHLTHLLHPDPSSMSSPSTLSSMTSPATVQTPSSISASSPSALAGSGPQTNTNTTAAMTGSSSSSRPSLTTHPSSSSRVHPPHHHHRHRRKSSKHPRHQSSIPSYPCTPRTRTLYLSGADPDTANSPPAFRCPRHLHTGCKICVEAKDTPSSYGGSGRGGGGGSGGGGGPGGFRGMARRDREGMRAGATGATGSGGGVGTNGAGVTGSNKSVAAAMVAATPIGISPDGGGITGYQDGSGIGSGLLRPSGAGSVLRRKTAIPYKNEGWSGIGGRGASMMTTDDVDATGSGNTKLSELVPRFLRLSALIAAELGREIREGTGAGSSGSTRPTTGTTAGIGFSTLPPAATMAEATTLGRSGQQQGQGQGQGMTMNPATPSQMGTAVSGSAGTEEDEFKPEPEQPNLVPGPSPRLNPNRNPSNLGKGNNVLDDSNDLNRGRSGSDSSGSSENKFYTQALRPSREWYLLLAGLVTRAALQGYLTAGWRGKDAVECLFMIGRGIRERGAGRRRRGRRRKMRRKAGREMGERRRGCGYRYHGDDDGYRERRQQEWSDGSGEDEEEDDEDYEDHENYGDGDEYEDHHDDGGEEQDGEGREYGDEDNYEYGDDSDEDEDDEDGLGTSGIGVTWLGGVGGAVDDDELFEDFEPDELPSLTEAVRILFPSLRTGVRRGGKGKGKAKGKEEEEFEREMDERLKKFYNIPLSTPDLSTHLEDLAWEYPCEPVERAACRFGEAIGRWRGKPELEGYKKKPLQPNSSLHPDNPSTSVTVNNNSNKSHDSNNNPEAAPSTPMMTIESLVHSNPTSPTTGHPGVASTSSGGDQGKGKEKERSGAMEENSEEDRDKEAGGESEKKKQGIEIYFLMPENWTGGGINNIGKSPTVSRATLPKMGGGDMSSSSTASGASNSNTSPIVASMAPPGMVHSTSPGSGSSTSMYGSYQQQSPNMPPPGMPNQIPMQQNVPNIPNAPQPASPWGMWAASAAAHGSGPNVTGGKRTRSPDDSRMGMGMNVGGGGGGQGGQGGQGQGPAKRFHASMG
ncbi:hypothetical protein K435DRAFT_970239 [Dendrothele bispora CBS 962.96]|uniref:Uncharacterized protein n=1 Tax=Dendrothele bispora (strain CBS 962.96) TaxID=1314807 RepID=A0A4V4HDA8_DENBC|nr:hypothetical protein K435DRAFT_970239 [Dendrothele bispora CBS 962.96]